MNVIFRNKEELVELLNTLELKDYKFKNGDTPTCLLDNPFTFLFSDVINVVKTSELSDTIGLSSVAKCPECKSVAEALKVLDSEKSLSKADRHKAICERLTETYRAKNHDYGDSFTKLRGEYPNAILMRLQDKMSRLKVLKSGEVQMVKDESIKDTLMDMANYCIMEVIEMEAENGV